MLRAATAFLAAVALVAVPTGEVLARGKRASKPTVLILRTESSALDDAARMKVTDAVIGRAKRYKNYKIAISASDLVEEMFEFECTEAGVECLTRIGSKYKADLVVYSEISKTADDALEMQMRLVDARQQLVAQSTRQPLATTDEAARVAERGLIVLLGPVDLPTTTAVEAGFLHVQLVGGGIALVYVDDKLVGRLSVTGLKVKLAPGSHNVRVVRAGFKEWTGAVAVASGATRDLDVTLAAEEASAMKPKPMGPAIDEPVTSKWWFWTAIGVGAVAIAGVAVWAASGGEETKVGSLELRIDSDLAHKDPVFSGN